MMVWGTAEKIQAQFRRWGELVFTYRKLSLSSIDGATTQIKIHLMSKFKVPPKFHLVPWKWASDRTSIMQNWRGGWRRQVWRRLSLSTFQILHFSDHSDQQKVKVLLHELLGTSRIFEYQEEKLLVEPKKGDWYQALVFRSEKAFLGSWWAFSQ